MQKFARRCVGFTGILLLSFNLSYAEQGGAWNAAYGEGLALRQEETGADFRQRLNDLVDDMKQKRQEEAVVAAELSARYMPKAKAHDMDGKVGIVDESFEYSHGSKAFDKLPLGFSLKSKYIGLDNSTQVKLPAKMTAVTAGLEATLPLFSVDKTYLRIGAYPSFFGDDWSFEASSFRTPARLFFIHQPQDNLIFIAGVAVFPRFRSSVFPIVGVIYKPNEKLAFNLTPDRPNISYAFTDKLTVFAMGDAYYGEFEVDKDGQDAILQYKEYMLGSGFTFKFCDSVSMTFTGGSTFGRYLKYRDSLGKVNVDNGGFVEFRTEIKL